MSGIVNRIKYAMSLRTPQEEALSYLDAISTHCDYKKNDKEAVEAVASEYCENNRKIRTKFDFPSFCYSMATGIGKTRLMGACIYYLYKTKGYKHFFILAPGNTIYEKLRKESNPAHPKYIFKGLEAEMGKPRVFDGENMISTQLSMNRVLCLSTIHQRYSFSSLISGRFSIAKQIRNLTSINLRRRSVHLLPRCLRNSMTL